MVPSANADEQPQATIFSAISKKSDSSTQNLREASTTFKTSFNGSQDNVTTVKFLEASLRQSTNCKHNNYIKNWLAYPETMRKIEVTRAIDFLSAMFEKEHAYSIIDNEKCTIAIIVHIPPYDVLNKHPLVNKYMAGIFNLRPPKPKLSFVWVVDILFRYFEH